MITKYNLFESKLNIEYLSDGEFNCPVCGGDKLSIFEYENNYDIQCKNCDFEFSQIYENNFNGSETYIDDHLVEISNTKRHTQYNFFSTGEVRCPYCDSKDINLDGSDTNGEEDYDDMSCYDCKNKEGDPNTWRLYYINTFEYSVDFNNKKIIKGEKVDNNLFDEIKYKKSKSSKFNL